LGPFPVKPYISRLRGEYVTYDEALAACAAPVYDSGHVGAVTVADRLKIYRKRLSAAASRPQAPITASRLLPYQAAYSFVDRRDLAILDVGGGDSRDLYELRGLYGDSFHPRYDILEAPEVVAACRQMNIPDVSYFDDPQQLACRRYSHILFGAMLQIMPDPQAFFEGVLAAAASDYVFITVFPEATMPDGFQGQGRLAIKGKKTKTGIDMSHPYWVFSTAHWHDLFRKYGEIVMAFDMPRYRYKQGGEIYAQHGYLIRRHAQAVR
jgi:putative methyltransferase (TIGR04325 family)